MFICVSLLLLLLDCIHGDYLIQRPFISSTSCVCLKTPTNCLDQGEKYCVCPGYAGIDCSSFVADTNPVVSVSTYILNPCSEIPLYKSVRSVSGVAGFYWKTSRCSINVQLNDFNFTFDNGNGNLFNYDGVISGHGNLFLFSRGINHNEDASTSIALSGSQPNENTGLLVVSKGIVFLQKPSNVTSINCDFLLLDNAPFVGIVWSASDQVADTAVGNVSGTRSTLRYLQLYGYTETFTGLNLDSKSEIRISSPGILYLSYLTIDGAPMKKGIYTSSDADFIKGSGAVHVGIYANCESNNPCENNGVCSPLTNASSGYVCSNCMYTPCNNGGTCTLSLRNLYQCTCMPGYSGRLCETNIDECASNPCASGSCIDGINSYMCKINLLTSPFKNEGSYIDIRHGYICSCMALVFLFIHSYI